MVRECSAAAVISADLVRTLSRSPGYRDGDCKAQQNCNGFICNCSSTRPYCCMSTPSPACAIGNQQAAAVGDVRQADAGMAVASLNSIELICFACSGIMVL